jgi:hypothetical protein
MRPGASTVPPTLSATWHSQGVVQLLQEAIEQAAQIKPQLMNREAMAVMTYFIGFADIQFAVFT